MRAAKERDGEITSARLYALLVKDWLDYEHRRSLRISTRKGISREALDKGMVVLAMSMWHAKQKTVEPTELLDVLTAAMVALKEPVTDPELVTHLFGSGSLLVRDGEARFSFVHRSVMEWFVAREAAEELREKGDSGSLAADEMSPLMADFFHLMAGRKEAIAWAKAKRFGEAAALGCGYGSCVARLRVRGPHGRDHEPPMAKPSLPPPPTALCASGTSPRANASPFSSPPALAGPPSRPTAAISTSAMCAAPSGTPSAFADSRRVKSTNSSPISACPMITAFCPSSLLISLLAPRIVGRPRSKSAQDSSLRGLSTINQRAANWLGETERAPQIHVHA